jgi:diguanylate cyclase (GGDEF)-like protein
MDGHLALLLGGALLAAIIAMGLTFRNHARALARSRGDALTDTLTGLGNRRKLLEDLGDALIDPHAARLLVVLDLDGFKAYNDVYGHPAGDALLARLGRRIEAALPSGAGAYRLGGDEFCALVDERGTSYDAVVGAVSHALSDTGDGVSASHGVIAIPREADTAERALQLADQRLYADKSTRRRHSEARNVLTQALREPGPERSDAVAELAGRVAREMGLWGEQLELVVRAAELHDVGMAAMPDSIREQPQHLGYADRMLLSRHTLAGEHLLSSARPLSQVAALVRACDERFDGTGFPDGLAAGEIPLGARIVAACESYHALTAREGETRRAAILRMRQQAGAAFDPEVVEALAGATSEDVVERRSGRSRARAGMAAATIAVGTLLLALPGAAFAGTASVSRGELRVTASPGQTNKLKIEAGSDSRGSGALVTEDGPGATISPGPGCGIYAPRQVYCQLPSSIHVDAGDGNDTVTVYSWIGATLHGGPGNDQLFGSGGKDSIEGQDGNDVLGGPYGNDNVRGGPGNDTLTASYFTSPVALSLDGVANDGVAGDHSNVNGDVENLIGSPKDDTLVGNAAANVIDGGPGRDVIRGNGGGDTLRVRDNTQDKVFCGVGHDDVDADTSDQLGADCDYSVITSLQAPPLAPQPLRLDEDPVRMSREGVAPITLRCSSRLPSACRGVVTLDVDAAQPAGKQAAAAAQRRKVLGRARFTARRGKLKTVKVQISRNGRRRVLRKRRLRCRASVVVRRANGTETTVQAVLTLTAPKGGA